MGNKQTGNKTFNNCSEFSFRLYQQLSNSENLVFSPASLYIILSMVAIGAKGQTLEQFKQLLSFDNHELLAQNSANLQASLIKTGKGITSQTANQIYQGLPKLGQEYEQLISKNFGSAIQSVDFANNFEQIRNQVNQWVEKTTNEKIKDLLPEGSLNSLTRMVLVNAIYFKGDWLDKFDAQNTQKFEFALEYEDYGKSVEVDMMIKEQKYECYENKDYQFISLPYQGKEYAMEIIIPTQSLQKFEENLSHKVFLESRKNKKEVKVLLYLPKFKINPTQSIALKQILSVLGIPQSFSDQANFSFMDPKNSIKISNVFHKAMIEVNEEGAEAAAGTATVMTLRSCEPSPQYFCNKPFIYSITHIPTNTILFLGKVTNPAKN